MSEVKANDLSEINGPEDVYDLYQGVGRENAKSGIEVELAFFDPNTDDLDAMSLAQNKVLKNAADATCPNKDFVHNEPTSELLEVASFAQKFSDSSEVLSDINRKISVLCDKADGIGLKRSYFQELPDKTADDLLSRIVDVDRYKVMYAPYRADMYKCVQYFAVCKSNQVSVSPYDMNHLHQNIRRLYRLAPFLFLLTDNSCFFSEGKPHLGHIGMTLRHLGLTEGRGGVPPYVFEAENGEEFVRAHIDHVMNNPLFMYYDLEGGLNRVPSGDWSVTFNSLKERGLNTASNYYLAQSIMWPDVKVATLKDQQGDVFGHRYEARMFGVGIHQHQTAYIITSALAFDDTFAQEIDRLLARYEMNGYEDVLAAYAAARDHNGAFFDIPFGNATMQDFARDFADLIEPVIDRADLHAQGQALLYICRTGCTDAKVNRTLFKSLDDVRQFQKNYDISVFKDPNQCAVRVFEGELERLGYAGGTRICAV